MIKVAVSQRRDDHADRNEVRDALDRRLIDFLLKCDCLPVPVPSLPLDLLPLWLLEVEVSGIVLSGGNDIGQCLIRDRIEEQLLQYSISNDMPVFAICRGMQFLGQFCGAELVPVAGHVATRHSVKGRSNREVNSYHGYGLDKIPHELLVLSTSDDGVPEEICHQIYPWHAIMWHPEREVELSLQDIQLVKYSLRKG